MREDAPVAAPFSPIRERDLALGAEAAGELAGIVHLAETTSTQDAAFALGAPPRGARVVLADLQTAGRGRRGRAWSSAGASEVDRTLAITLIRHFDLPPRALAPLGPTVGLVVAQALRGLGAEVSVKWPNDLVHRDAKLAGLLIEARGDAVAIGLGVNLSLDALPGVEQPWTDLRRAGASATRVAVLGAVLRALLPALARFEREGFAAFAADWPALDALRGRSVRVMVGETALEGEALGVADDGGLRVRHADGERVHHAGEVSVRVAA